MPAQSLGCTLYDNMENMASLQLDGMNIFTYNAFEVSLQMCPFVANKCHISQ